MIYEVFLREKDSKLRSRMVFHSKEEYEDFRDNLMGARIDFQKIWDDSYFQCKHCGKVAHRDLIVNIEHLNAFNEFNEVGEGDEFCSEDCYYEYQMYNY